MKKLVTIAAIAVLGMTFSIPEAYAKRLGGGASIGRQRAGNFSREASRPPVVPTNPSAAPGRNTAPNQAVPNNTAANTGAAAGNAAAAAKPSFMNRWGGLIAGVGMGALLGSLFSGGFGGGLGGMLAGILPFLLIGIVALLAYRYFSSRRVTGPRPYGAAATANNSPDYAAVSRPDNNSAFAASATPFSPSFAAEDARHYADQPVSNSPVNPAVDMNPVLAASSSLSSQLSTNSPTWSPGPELDSFLRIAKTLFLRLQAANDARDVDDLRRFTTPEMFAELSMQLHERTAASQQTDVITLEAKLLDVQTDTQETLVSIRFYGAIREETGTDPEPFDEIWHLRNPLTVNNATWQIAGIQQFEIGA